MSKAKDKKKEMAKKMLSNESGRGDVKAGPDNESNKYKGGESKNEAFDKNKGERKYKLPKGGEDKR
jgi:hypothetical protein